MRNTTIFLLILINIFSQGFPQEIQSQNSVSGYLPFRDPSLSLVKRVDDLISRLTNEEKARMMLYNSPAISRLGIPEYNWWNECLHGIGRNGRATVFPQAIGMAASFDPELLLRVASAISDEARAKYKAALKAGYNGQYNGLSFWTPNINIFRDPRWGRGQETYGEDPYLTSVMGSAFVKGLQGNDPKYLKTAACAKHFAVHSGPEATRHHFNAVISDVDLRETYLPAFKALSNQGVEAFMCAYNRLNGEACCGSPGLLLKILRNEWGFKGHIVTDCWALDDIWIRHKIVGTKEEAALLAVKAGVNLNCGYIFQYLSNLVEQGKMSQKELDDLLKPLLRTRFRLGLFDPDSLCPYSDIPESVINCEKHKQITREMATASIVLLKNKNHILPLDKNIQKLYVTGPYMADQNVLLANYNGISGDMITVLEGITSCVSNASNVQYIIGNQLGYEKINGTWMAPNADATIVTLGLSPLLEGEEGDALLSDNGGDRKDLKLPSGQLELLRELRGKHTKPIIAVVMGGSCIDLSEVDSLADAVLFAWYPGEQGGRAIADIIFGNAVPSGRLPVTFYKSAEDLPAFDDYSMKNRTYRYFRGKVLYPFGYGLSYSDFKYDNLTINKETFTISDTIICSFTVSNNGKYDAYEVVQLYTAKSEQGPDDPVKSLRAFSKIFLKAGENRNIELKISVKELQNWDTQKDRWVLKKNDYTLLVGASSADIRLTRLFRVR